RRLPRATRQRRRGRRGPTRRTKEYATMLDNQAHEDNNTPPPAPEPEPIVPGGASCDEDHLASLEKKLQVVRDRTRGVVEGYATGLHVWGDGGIGKSFTVLRTLERLRADFTLVNSRLTGKGLFNNLEKFP